MALQYMIGCLSASLKLISGKFNVVATSKNGCQNGLQDLENAIISFFSVFGVAVDEFYVFLTSPSQINAKFRIF